jgi:hypothetical protein
LFPEKKYLENFVITKLSNKFFQNNSYSSVKLVSSRQTFKKLKNLLNTKKFTASLKIAIIQKLNFVQLYFNKKFLINTTRIELKNAIINANRL